MDDIDAAVPEGGAEQANAAPQQEATEPANDRMVHIERAISAWVVDRIHNSPVSRDTEGFSHLMTALAELGPYIAKEI